MPCMRTSTYVSMRVHVKVFETSFNSSRHRYHLHLQNNFEVSFSYLCWRTRSFLLLMMMRVIMMMMMTTMLCLSFAPIVIVVVFGYPFIPVYPFILFVLFFFFFCLLSFNKPITNIGVVDIQFLFILHSFFMPLIIHSFTLSFTHSLTHWLTHLHTHIHTFIHSFIHYLLACVYLLSANIL